MAAIWVIQHVQETTYEVEAETEDEALDKIWAYQANEPEGAGVDVRSNDGWTDVLEYREDDDTAE